MLSIVGLITLVWAIIEAPVQGWTDGTTIGAFAFAAVLLGAFIAWERRSDHPMLDVGFFANPRFSAASTAVTLVFASSLGSGVPAVARTSVGAALDLARSLGGEQGAALTASARSAYVDGMGVGVLVAAAVALIGSLVALAFLPSRATMEPDLPSADASGHDVDLEVATA